MDLKTRYAQAQRLTNNAIYLSSRLFNTYNRITKKLLGKNLSGVNVDLGSGDGGFSIVCKKKGITSYALNYPDFDIEKDRIDLDDNSVDFVTMNAVIEHIKNIDSIMNETYRVLKPNGLLFIRTPNWKLDFKNFYNDPTHITPYTPERLKNLFHMFNFKTIFLEPGLIEKSWFWWKLPEIIKWRVASWLRGGTRSIIGVAQK